MVDTPNDTPMSELHDPNAQDDMDTAKLDRAATPPLNEAESESPTESRQPVPVGSRRFEDLSLGEVFGRIFSRPRQTTDALRQTLTALPEDRGGYYPMVEDDSNTFAAVSAANAEGIIGETAKREPFNFRALVLPITLIGITALAIAGSFAINNPELRTSTDFPTMAVLMFFAIGASAVATAVGLQSTRLPALPLPAKRKLGGLEALLAIYGLRIALLGFALLATYGAWTLNAIDHSTNENHFTIMGILCWVCSIAAWAGVLYDGGFALDRIFARVANIARKPITIRWSWTVIALILIFVGAAWFRFRDVRSYPPDMTSDHVEKALDAQKVLNGDWEVYFPNNGGRESFQMYYLAALHELTQLPISFNLLKIGSGLEGMLMVLLAWWMGRALFGDEDKHLANLVGLIAAAMIAVSYWHTMLSRLGLRIVLTTVAVTVVFVFLARAIRHNRRADYLIAGTALGAGLYFYQAVRMLPVLVVVAVVMALIFRARSWRGGRSIVMNSAMLVIMAVVVFVPLGRYMSEYPSSFWERTGGRFFGEDVINITDAQGTVTGQREATNEDRIEALKANIPVFKDNYFKSLLMFNWHGDTAWITGEPSGSPELDWVTGAFFVVGVGFVLARIVRRRDPVDLMLIFGILIMILPTALSIAFVIEVPSATRASGALPLVYLVAALGMGLTVKMAAERLPKGILRWGVYAGTAVVLLFSASLNADTYFVTAMSEYRTSTYPYGQIGGLLKGFEDSTGAPGNAFMIAWPYWWDHRALAIESGDPMWPNGLLNDHLEERLIAQMQGTLGTKYELNPVRQMLFFLHPDDKDSQALVLKMFPGGALIPISTYTKSRDFLIYTAPPVGCKWAEDNLHVILDPCFDLLNAPTPDNPDSTPTPPGS